MEFRVYRIQEFLRTNESGDLDHDRVGQIVKELASAAASHPKHNMLLDLRATTALSFSTMTQILQVALEFEPFLPVLGSKIANVVPADPNRVEMDRTLEACLKLKSLDYQVFTDFEQAIEWLSETRPASGRVT